MYDDSKKRLNTIERTKHQNSIEKLNPDRYRRKDITKQNSNRLNENRETDK